MGIYIFKKQALLDSLANNTMDDFGREVIPASLKKKKVLIIILLLKKFYSKINNHLYFLLPLLDKTLR